MPDLGKAVFTLATNNKPFVAGMAKSEAVAASGSAVIAAKFTKMGSGFESAGRKLRHSFTVPLLAVGGVAIKMSMDFEDSMSKIVGLVGVSKDQVDAWGQQILTMGKQLPQSPRELADALFFVTSAGFRGQQAMDILTMSAKAAAAGLGDTKTVADAVTSAVNAYGAQNLSAAQATDIMVATVRAGKMPAADLASSLGNVISVAAKAGVSFDEVGASIASMTRVGLNAHTSVTALRGILSTATKPTTQASKALDKMGWSVKGLQDSIDKKGLLPTLLELQRRTHGNTSAMAQIVPNVRALSGVLTLVGNNAKANAQIFHDVAHAAGSTERAFKEAATTAKFKLGIAMATIKDSLIIIGSKLLPIVGVAFGWLSAKVGTAVTWFQSLSGTQQKWIGIMLAVMAAAGPILMWIGAVVSAIGTLIPVVAALCNPWGALAAVLIYVGVQWLRTGNNMAIFQAKISAVAAFVKNVAWPAIQRAAQQALQWYKTNIAPTIASVASNVRATLTTWFSWGRAAWAAWGSRISAVVQAAFGLVVTFVKTNIQIVGGIISTVLAVLRGDWGGAWSSLKGIVVVAVTGVIAALRGMVGLMGAAARLLWAVIKTVVPAALSGLAHAVVSVVKAALSGIKSLAGWAVKQAMSIGRAVIDGVVHGIESGASKVTQAAEHMAAHAFSAATKHLGINSPSRLFRDGVGKPIGEGIAVGIHAKKADVAASLVGLLNDIRKADVKSAAATLVSGFTVQGPALTNFFTLASSGLDKYTRTSAAADANTIKLLGHGKGARQLASAYNQANAALVQMNQQLPTLAAAISDQQKKVDGLSQALNGLSNIQIAGSQAFSDQAFGIDQQVKDLQLKQVNLQIDGGVTDSAVSEFNNLTTQIATLQTEAAKTNIAPDAVQLAALNTQLAALPAGTADFVNMGTQIDVLHMKAERLNLTESLQLDPLRRQWDATINPIKELSFDNAVAQFNSLSAQHDVESDKLVALQANYTSLTDAINTYAAALQAAMGAAQAVASAAATTTSNTNKRASLQTEIDKEKRRLHDMKAAKHPNQTAIKNLEETIAANERKLAALPALAKGGIVTKPTMALVGEGKESEAVMPLSHLQSTIEDGARRAASFLAANGEQMRGSGSGNGGSTHIDKVELVFHGEVDPFMASRAMRSAIISRMGSLR